LFYVVLYGSVYVEVESMDGSVGYGIDEIEVEDGDGG
ncbi:hypothetical protein Tco_0611976, partial [Tanacetum coccineum]